MSEDAENTRQKQLWAPWRLAYVKNDQGVPQDACFLCRYRDQADDAANFVVARGRVTLTVLNRFPYNNGHLLVAPAAHKASLSDLDDAEHVECMQEVTRMIGLLQRVIRPDGFNVGLNLGKVAGAGLPGHLHWHIVPRWNGDTNFLPVLADVKVIPQSLQALYELLEEQIREEAVPGR